MQQEWVEVRGPSVEEAVQAGLEELGITSVENAEIEVIQEPKRRFLVRVQDAVVKIKAKPVEKKRRRRRRKPSEGATAAEGSSARRESPQRQRQAGGSSSKRTDGAKAKNQRQRRASGEASNRGGERKSQERKPQRQSGGSVATEQPEHESAQPKPEPAEQAEVVVAFLKGLLSAFGLEGTVDSRVEDGAIYVDVSGEQTEALVGTKGAIMQSILELSRTVVQRKTFGSARLRLDIAGYGARRHKALEIYAARLAEQVKEDGEEVMLEPMNPADRKVVHDAVGAIDGVRTYSEGQEPNRSVVIALAPGYEPTGGSAGDEEAPGDGDADDEGADSESE